MGLKMMKYIVNHHENFTNPYGPFLLALMNTLIAIWVEVNVMIIMANLADILSVILKYISLASIVNIPREYFASLKEHKMLIAGGYQLNITKFRHMNHLENAPFGVKILRGIYKLLRSTFAAFSFYFMPFLTIIFNFSFMISMD